MFQFENFDRICGETIDLLIQQKVPEDQQKGRVPAYKYYIVLSQTDFVVGEIDLRIGNQESLFLW